MIEVGLFFYESRTSELLEKGIRDCFSYKNFKIIYFSNKIIDIYAISEHLYSFRLKS